MNLSGCCVLITGASQGLGFEIAKHFVSEGARVMICARDVSNLLSAKNELLKIAVNDAQVFSLTADISKKDDVERLVSESISRMGKLDVLVANAGIYGPKGCIEETDWEEWSAAIDINLKGTVLQCRSVIPYFKKQGSGKIIILSGGGATKPMPFLSAYAASKAGVVRFAETLAEEVSEYHIDVNTIAPGSLNTRLLGEILEAGPQKVGEKFYASALQQQENGGTAFSIPVSLCSFLASSKSNGITGKLLSALWDPWSKLPELIDELKRSDIYTLRRIIPSDRNKSWDEML